MKVDFDRLRKPTATEPVLLYYVDPRGASSCVDVFGAGQVQFEHCRPSRQFTQRPNQHHTPGEYWSATSQNLLSYESYLEGRWMKIFDFAHDVVAMSAQPFLIRAIERTSTQPQRWSAYPDLFLRLRDGGGRVVQVKNDYRARDEDVRIQSDRVEKACHEAGFDYQFVTEPDPVLEANVSWLSAYRRQVVFPLGLEDQLLEAAAEPVELGRIAALYEVPEVARAAIFQLCWFHRLRVDLSTPLDDDTLVQTALQEDS